MNQFYLLFFLQCAFCSGIYAQESFGSISGKVIDTEYKEPLPFVNVALDVGGTLIGTTTDFDGVYQLDSIEIGVYKVTFSSVGMQTKVVEDIRISENQTTVIEVQLEETNECIFWCPHEVIQYNPPLFSRDDTRSGIIIRRNWRGKFDYFNIR